MLKIREHDGGRQVWDPVRVKWVALTPEEHVRQSVIEYILDELKVPKSLMGVEFSLTHIEPGNLRQVDILVWKPSKEKEGGLNPWLLVECKRPGIAIDKKMGLQLAGYLSKIRSRHLMLTNGPDVLYYRLEVMNIPK